MPHITLENIDQHRGFLTIGPSDLQCDIWDIFDKEAFEKMPKARIVSLKDVVSTKDEQADEKFLRGLKPDPRQIAYGHMQRAAAKNAGGRAPIEVRQMPDGLFYIVDGNATAQVLMMARWKSIAVCIVGGDARTPPVGEQAIGENEYEPN